LLGVEAFRFLVGIDGQLAQQAPGKAIKAFMATLRQACPNE
jgi:hypothetical protein